MNAKTDIERLSIGVVGLGYVGLPLAVEFGRIRKVIGFDKCSKRIQNLLEGVDETMEVTKEEIESAEFLDFTCDLSDLKNLNCYIICVPTPIDDCKKPDLSMLLDASKAIGGLLSKGDIVIYESTVFPGATEEECVPILENFSGLKFNVDFFCGYSPERINPGDKEHRLPLIKKVTSGSTPEIATLIDHLYNQIITAGTHKAESIRIAEAAKVIENTQRDVNIALINELSIIFSKMEIDTQAVLKAASSKWNFLPFWPGLVGGHCIGVDPYYLTHKAESLGYQPEIILAGRRINDAMGGYVAKQLITEMKKRKIYKPRVRILVMGLTFKENCPDTRNSRVFDLIEVLQKSDCLVEVYDPWVSGSSISTQIEAIMINDLKENSYDGIIIAVSHEVFRVLGAKEIRKLGKMNHVLYDLKYMFRLDEVDIRL